MTEVKTTSLIHSWRYCWSHGFCSICYRAYFKSHVALALISAVMSLRPRPLLNWFFVFGGREKKTSLICVFAGLVTKASQKPTNCPVYYHRKLSVDLLNQLTPCEWRLGLITFTSLAPNVWNLVLCGVDFVSCITGFWRKGFGKGVYLLSVGWKRVLSQARFKIHF